ncbi:MAG: elongator complex protein 3 [Patescibacteria group bacterium]
MQNYRVDIKSNKSNLVGAINEIATLSTATDRALYNVFKKYPIDDGKMLSKSGLLLAYKKLKKQKLIKLTESQEIAFLKNVRMKKVRTVSGVTPVTVLTKPFPCPGKCIFCPNDVRMPKSYLSDEPGAQRAEMNKFDPYFQTFNRLMAFRNTGHPTDKVELLVLGGTWSFYPESYQIWFIKRCFDAMHDFGETNSTKMLTPNKELPFEESMLEKVYGVDLKDSYNKIVSKALATKRIDAMNESSTWEELFEVHEKNVDAKCRCVGLVIETRPDEITKAEVLKIRRLGATKVQIGIQSMDDTVLKKNKRGHNVAKTRRALCLLRQAGFKIHAHWMPNLYGSSPEKDIEDFKKLFSDNSIRPDELKIYPCSLIESAELMKYYKDGSWKPYTHEELLNVLVNALPLTPRYCRLTRVIRDIPSTDIVAGNKMTNFRQIAEKYLSKHKIKLEDIRSREIKRQNVSIKDLKLRVTTYSTSVSKEYFLEYITKTDKIAAFLRLSVPTKPTFVAELKNCTVIREVHVYGQSLNIGESKAGKAQHSGLGKALIAKAKEISAEEGFRRVGVISAIGTRGYYKKLGFELSTLYQVCDLQKK